MVLILAAVLASSPTLMIPVGDFDEDTIVPAMRAYVAQVMNGEKHVYFRIDSHGGSIALGIKFMQLIDEGRKFGVRTTCVVDGNAMSMGFVFLQSACDRRWMTRRSVLLAHKGSMGTQGTADDLREAADMIEHLTIALSAVCAERMGMTTEGFLARIRNRAWVMSYQDALEANAVDKVVSPLELPPVLAL